ncbi:unnamed protein product, partial [Ranitomeya imitator]
WQQHTPMVPVSPNEGSEKQILRFYSLVMCFFFFRSVQSNGGPQNIELSIKSLMLKVSPVIINTVITITSALSTSRKESISEATSPVPPDLWKKKDLKNLKLWFLEEENEKENKNSEKDQIVLTGEKLDLSIDSIVITLEAGVGHRTLPILLAKSSFKGNVKNWTTLINLYCQLELEVHYYNEMFGVWEPLLEPLEIEKSDSFRPWSLEVKGRQGRGSSSCVIILTCSWRSVPGSRAPAASSCGERSHGTAHYSNEYGPDCTPIGVELHNHYCNEAAGAGEPGTPRQEQMKKKLRKQSCEIDGEEENYKIPDYVTAINIFSKDQLNITLSKCGIVTLTNLGQAFAEAASKTSDVFKKDQAPFVIQNFLGLPISVSPSDSFTAFKC